RRFDEALAPIEESIEIRRRLAASSPMAHGSDLARSLMVLSECLAGVDRTEEALAAAEEGTMLHRQLFDAHPEAFTRVFVRSLVQLTSTLLKLDRRDEAERIFAVAAALDPTLLQLDEEDGPSEP